MSKVPSDVNAESLYVASRRVLLDAIDALKDHRDALILVGAQAVYLRSERANLAVAAFTADADLGIDREHLRDMPLLEQAMADADFELGDPAGGRTQPGQWFRPVEVDGKTVSIPVDLLIPEQFSGSTNARKRSGNIPPHDGKSVRRVSGLEVALVDNSVVEIRSLESDRDNRAARIRVAGVPALLVAKAYKIIDRVHEAKQDRLTDKDAGDVIRLMRTSDARAVAATFGVLLQDSDERIQRTAETGLEYLHALFGRVRGDGIAMAERALTGALTAETVQGLATAYVRELPGRR
jgi:hypothetical protein